MGVVIPKRSVVDKVDARAKSGKCLHCESEATKRGVCDKHYMAYVRALSAKPRAERGEFEAECIRDGKILPTQYIRELKSDNPFAEKSA